MRRKHSGFTLVEIAIVLVIIGLLLGGVLKGQELINSAKAKAVINDFRNTATMIAAYQDRFRALPGDDIAAATHLPSPAKKAEATGQTQGNGAIEGSWDSEDPKSESVLFWQHLRLANLTSGDTSEPTSSTVATWVPRNTEGGRIGVQSTAPINTAPNWQGRLFVCQGNISGRIAMQVDTTMDDGNPSQGSVRFGTWASGALTPVTVGTTPPTFSENELYTVCASF